MIYIYMDIILVGGFKHLLFSILYGMSSFPLTLIFFKMVKTTNQYLYEPNKLIISRQPKAHVVIRCWSLLGARSESSNRRYQGIKREK